MYVGRGAFDVELAPYEINLFIIIIIIMVLWRVDWIKWNFVWQLRLGGGIYALRMVWSTKG